MKKLKNISLGLMLLVVSLVLVACSSGPKGTYTGKILGVDVTLKVDGKKGTMTSESNLFGSSSSTTEELTIDSKSKSMKADNGNVYDYEQEGDKLTLKSSGLTVNLTKEK